MMISKGELQLGLKQGHGKYFYLNMNVYDGLWMKDKKHGKGTINNLTTGYPLLILQW